MSLCFASEGILRAFGWTCLSFCCHTWSNHGVVVSFCFASEWLLRALEWTFDAILALFIESWHGSLGHILVKLFFAGVCTQSNHPQISMWLIDVWCAWLSQKMGIEKDTRMWRNRKDMYHASYRAKTDTQDSALSRPAMNPSWDFWYYGTVCISVLQWLLWTGSLHGHCVHLRAAVTWDGVVDR